MKVTQQSEPKFIPVVITLETQEEVDILYDLASRVTGAGKVRNTTDMIHESLHQYVSPVIRQDYFAGNVTVAPTKS